MNGTMTTLPATMLLGIGAILGIMKGWALGHCANCDAPLDANARPALFCCERCKDYAKDVRYFRSCVRDGRISDPEVREVLRTRMAFLVVGGYNSKERRLDPAMRSAVLAANCGLCCLCNELPSTEVDHISGPSGDRTNLQGLCDKCHNIKTAESFQPMEAEHKAIRDAFLSRVEREAPLRASDDDLTWKERWPSLLAETRAWHGSTTRK